MRTKTTKETTNKKPIEFVHTKIVPHALNQSKFLVLNTTLPFIPPYIGTLKQCQRAQVHAEKNTIEYLKNNPQEQVQAG